MIQIRLDHLNVSSHFAYCATFAYEILKRIGIILPYSSYPKFIPGKSNEIDSNIYDRIMLGVYVSNTLGNLWLIFCIK